MAVWSTVNASDIPQNFGRIDAEFFHPENIKVFNKVTSKKYFYFSELVLNGYRVVYTNTKMLPEEKISDNCPKFLQATNISTSGLNIDLENAGYVSESYWNQYSKGQIKPGELLIEVKGQAEKVSIVPEDIYLRTLVSGSLFKVSIDKSKVSPWYIFTYFSTKHGKLLRDRLKTNTLIGFVSKPQLYSIPVFIPENQSDVDQIATLSETAYNLLKDSKKLYIEAQEILESELGLTEFSKPENTIASTKYSIVNLTDSFTAGRIDAQCFQPEAIAYENWLLKQASCERLHEFITSVEKGRQQKEVDVGDIDYCSIKHINGCEIIGASKSTLLESTPIAVKNDLLLAITGATIGKIGIVNRYEKLIFSGDMLRLRANSLINPHYLLLVLDHHIGQVQFNRWITGSTNGHLAPRDVGRVLIPRISLTKEQQISKLVEIALEKRLKSENLLEQAKSRIEQLIEEAAMK